MGKRKDLHSIIGAFLVICLWGISFSDVALATEYKGSNIISNNIHDHVYTTTSKVSNSYISVNSNNTFTRVENYGDVILVETYNSSFKVISQTTIPFELSLFGGFYSGQNYNYFLFGQNNYSDQTNAEVIRLVQYTKDWKRRNVYCIGDCDLSVPFYGANTDFSEYGDTLYIRCGHLTYADTKGFRKQGPLTISVKQGAQEINDVQGTIKGASYGSLENVGSCYIETEGGAITAVDHSLTAPFAAVASSYHNHAGTTSFESTCINASALGQYAGINGKQPGFSIGGMEASSQYYLIAANAGIADGSAANKNVAIMAVPRNGFSDDQVKISYLTGFAGVTYTAETPFIVKVNSDKFCVLWEQRDGYADTCKTYYAFIDGSGQRLTDVSSITACLSDCQPVVYNNKIIWYTTNGAKTSIYSISLSGKDEVSPSKVYNNSAVYKGVDFSKVYDYSYYCSRYPDIRVLYSNNPSGALSHFVTSGMAEGRQACDNFDVYKYKANYPDLYELYGDDLRKYYVHFVLYGSAEGRNGRTYN